MEVRHYQLQSMGTRMDLVFGGEGVKEAGDLQRTISGELERIESRLSLYRPDSLLSMINNAISTVELDEEMNSIFMEIGYYHRATGGLFDPSVRPAGERPFPSGWDRVEIRDSQIMKPAGLRIDLGGYGKGYALRRIRSMLEESRICHALISFGESSILGYGTHPAGPPWKLSIHGGEGGEACIFELRDESLSTSGNSLNNQKKFANSGHIVNPLTGERPTRIGLVSVKAKDPVLCEVYSTALFAAGPGEIASKLGSDAGLEFCWTGLQ